MEVGLEEGSLKVGGHGWAGDIQGKDYNGTNMDKEERSHLESFLNYI